MEKATPNEIFAKRSEEQIEIHRQRLVPTNSPRTSRFDSVSTSDLVFAFNKRFPHHMVSAETLRKWRSGTSLPRCGNLENWAAFLNTTADYLLPSRSAEQLGKEKALLELNTQAAPDYLRNVKAFDDLEPEVQQLIWDLLKLLPKRKRPA
jgi:transcriptional regulator with XRE-family HTH domain